MFKSTRHLALCGLAATLLLSSGQTASAGIIPWTYNAIFGPVGSTFAPRRAFRMSQFGGACCTPSFNSCGSCNTCNYGASYGAFYGSYDYGCSSCGGGGCQSCGFGCATGNCASGNCSTLAPATGITPTPAQPTPTQTFQSSRPTVNPDADKVDINNGNSTFGNDRFEQPTRSNDNNGNGGNGSNNNNNSGKSNDSSSAPAFSPFGSSSSTESLKVPATPMVPVPKRQPAPADLEGNGGLQLPTLRFEPAPVAVDETNISLTRTPTLTRTVRTVRYEVPAVVRNAPQTGNEFLPPLPALQLVGK